MQRQKCNVYHSNAAAAQGPAQPEPDEDSDDGLDDDMLMQLSEVLMAINALSDRFPKKGAPRNCPRLVLHSQLQVQHRHPLSCALTQILRHHRHHTLHVRVYTDRGRSACLNPQRSLQQQAAAIWPSWHHTATQTRCSVAGHAGFFKGSAKSGARQRAAAAAGVCAYCRLEVFLLWQ